MKILLDYVFPITVITPTPAASTAFLKQACLVVKPKSGQEGNVGKIFECVSMAEVEALTDNNNAEQMFAAGMTRVFILLTNDLDIADALLTEAGEFFTVIISDDFDDDDIVANKATLTEGDLTFTAKDAGSKGNDISIEFLDSGTAGAEVVTVTDKKISVSMESGVSTAQQLKTAIDNSAAAMALIDPVTIDTGKEQTAQAAFAEKNLAGGDGLFIGSFNGVVGIQSQDKEFAKAQAAMLNRVAFFSSVENKAKNMCYAFGSLLSNLTNWLNQQYIAMPFGDGVDSLGEANSLFDDRVSFVINDTEFGNRLALFAAGGRAIVAPYIIKNLMVDLQSRALQWISANQPQYTIVQAKLLQTRLQEDVINSYIARGWIESGSVNISLFQNNFVASGQIDVPEPKALWRVFSELRTSN